MAITLTDGYAVLSLANDYFPFDQNYADFEEIEESQTLTTFIWLHMRWHNVGVVDAKETVKQATTI
jgi:hypothetical protein